MLSYLDHTHLNQTEVPAARLNIENKKRSNLFRWNGQFSPQFVEAILERYANQRTRILDPFCGSGTVLAEAASLGLAATGIEVNPAAYVLARIYTFCNMTPDIRQVTLDAVEIRLQGIFPTGWPFFKTLDIKTAISYQRELITLRDISPTYQRIVLEALIILADFYNGINALKLAKTWGKLRQIIEGLSHNTNPIDVRHQDGRFLDPCDRFDLVLTSPPYINVYNYHQQYRASAEALGWDLLAVARTEIGSNRKHRGNRFLTVTQYCLDLTLALHSIWEATSQNARLILILGRESRVRGVPFLNGEIVARLAIDAVGYRLLLRQERVFINRFGQQIYEDILHFEKFHGPFIDSQERARTVADRILRQGLVHAIYGAVRGDLLDAIEKVAIVPPSPHYAPQLNHTLEDVIKNGQADTSSGKTQRNSH
ncbi:MAG: methyltransferase [Nitrospirae bacterium]|nr:methyltransferase [Nitrospirota bacterium]